MRGCRGACVVAGGACMVARGGVFARGHACLLGGVCGCGEACIVVGGICGCWGVCIGYDEIRSMSGRYASYWNAFLLDTSLKHLIIHLLRNLILR